MSQYQPMYDSFQRVNQERFVPCERINVAASVFAANPIMDEKTGRVQQEQPRRRRTQAMRIEKEKLEKQERELEEFTRREAGKKGPRVRLLPAFLIAFSVFFICSIVLLSMQGQAQFIHQEKTEKYQEGQKLNGEIERLKAEIESQLDVAMIGTTALNELDLVRVAKAEAVQLLAVDTRPTMGSVYSDKQVIETSEHAPRAQAEK